MVKKPTVLITGATGFVGRMLSYRYLAMGWTVRGTVRPGKAPSALPPGVEAAVFELTAPASSWRNVLQNVDIVVHLAARVHVMRETAPDPLAEFRIANAHGTVLLAKEAEAAGVKRFVFLSTIGVNGDNSGLMPFREESTPAPHNAYAISKYEAEERLAVLAAESGMGLVVLRAPLVYGPGNPGNFLSLLRAVASGIPLPFAAVNNRRSFLYVENLVDALEACTIHPAAKGTFLVCDGEDLSIADLIRRIAVALDVPVRLFPCPLALLELAGILAGKAGAVRQLTSSLQINCAKIRGTLGWVPPCSVDEGLLKTAKWFRQVQKNRCV